MEQSVVIKHVSGTKRPAVEQISIAGRRELVAGRAPSCDIRYDLTADDLVSRRHMKIEIAGTGEPEFTIVDLKSRNGTFINKRRIKGPSKLQPGDVVQLGAGGPEFVFDLDPPHYQTVPAEKTTAYNVVSEIEGSESKPAKFVASKSRSTKGRPSRFGSKRRTGLLLVAAIILLACAGAALMSRSQSMHVAIPPKSGWTFLASQATTMSRAAGSYGRDLYNGLRMRLWGSAKGETAQNKSPGISGPNGFDANSLASLEVGWMLLDARSGRQLRQVYIDNLKAGSGVETSPIVPNGGRSLPLFVLLSNHQLQPVLTLSDDVNYRPIGGIYRNPGFLATADGLIFTAARIATPWAAPYEWPTDAVAGVVAIFDKHLKLVNTGAIARRQFPNWLPLESQFVLADSMNAPTLHLANGRVQLEGRTDYLTATVGSESGHVPGRVIQASDRFGLGVIRIDTHGLSGQRAPAAQLRAGSGSKPGDEAVLVNLVSPPLTAKARSVSEVKAKVISLRNAQGTNARSSRTEADRYELAVNSEVTAEPGAPVFDEQGRVFAVVTAADPLFPASVFAIPIRYGVGLLRLPGK